MQDHSTFQPVILAVGEVTKVNNYYVVVKDKLFTVETSLSAVQLALNIFFSLDCAYPQNTRTIWVFLQKILYDIHLPLDLVNVETNAMLGFIKTLTN